jgi:hypothetical protein
MQATLVHEIHAILCNDVSRLREVSTAMPR